MNKKKLFTDYIFNMFRMVLNIGLPVFVLPYVLNRIGPENYGVFSYANSIVSYFCMFAALGIPEYAARVVSRQKDSPDLGRIVTEVVVIQFAAVALTLGVYLGLFYSFFFTQYKDAFLVFAILILSNALNVEWFFVGTQRFKFISIRGIILKIINVIFLVLFIEHGDDYLIYTLITVLTTFANSLVNFLGILKLLRFKGLKLAGHIKPVFLLFSLNVAGLINGSLDKTITGMLVGPLYVGYYSLGFRLSRIILQLFTALNNVIYPRVMAYQSQDDDAQSRKLIRFNMDYIFMLSVPILFGMFVYGDDIIRLLFEPEMMPAVSSLVILTFIIPIQAVRRLLRQQVLLPRDRDRVILVITIISIVSNVLLNLLLVPRYYHVGAAAATLVVEFVDMALALVYISVVFKMNLFALRHLKYVIAGPVVLIPYFFYARDRVLGFPGLLLIVVLSAGLYFVMLFLLKDSIVYKLSMKIIKKRSPL